MSYHIISHPFCIFFIGFQYHVEFSTRSNICVIDAFLTAVPDICQGNCINKNPIVSFEHLLIASLRKTLSQVSFSFIGPSVWNSFPPLWHSLYKVHSSIQSFKTSFQEWLPVQLNSNYRSVHIRIVMRCTYSYCL